MAAVASLVEAQNVPANCAADPISRLQGTIGRARVDGDFLVVQYGALEHQTDWYDYRHFRVSSYTPHTILRNGSLLPVVFSREKIAVHVCQLHFTDQLTVTTSPLALPEGGADLRGYTTVTPIAPLTNTLDAIQNGVVTGVPVQQSGVGFSSTQALTAVAVTGVAPGTITVGSDGKATYTDANVTVSGRQLAQMLFAVKKNAEALLSDVLLTQKHTPTAQIVPGSLDSINQQADRVQQKIDRDTNQISPFFSALPAIPLYSPAQLAQASNAAAFDEDVTAVQGIAAQMTTLASTLATDAFGARALQLQSNFATILGVLDLIGQGSTSPNCKVTQPAAAPPPLIPRLTPAQVSKLKIGDLAMLSADDLAAMTAEQVASLTVTAGQVATLSDDRRAALAGPHDPAPQAPAPSSPMTPDQVGALTSVQLSQMTEKDFAGLSTDQIAKLNATQIAGLRYDQLKGLLAPRAAAPPAPAARTGGGDDQPACGRFEATKFKQFNQSFEDEIGLIAKESPEAAQAETRDRIEPLFVQLRLLKQQLQAIDLKVGKVFDTLDYWYQASQVEQTDLIAPQNNNSMMRISIIVQRGFTPFSFSTAPVAAASTAAPSAAGATASTGTPAHAVGTVLVEVHRLANFNLAGGVMIIHVPTSTFSLGPAMNAVAVPPAAGSSAPTMYYGSCATPAPATIPQTPANNTPGNTAIYACILTNQQTQWQVAGMAGISWYPWGRDYFPRRKGYTNYARNFIPAILVGTSVTSFGSGFGGLNFEPMSGIDLFAGVASANRSVLPNGITATTMVPTSGFTLSPGSQVHAGFAAGIAFDFGLFGQLFAKGTPTGVAGTTLP